MSVPDSGWIWSRFNRANVDLMATRENTQCKLFFSMNPWDEAPLEVNALAHKP